MNRNTSSGDGGGIYSFYGTVDLKGSARVNRNTSSRTGGGIYDVGGTVTLNDSSQVNGNTASGDGGVSAKTVPWSAPPSP